MVEPHKKAAIHACNMLPSFEPKAKGVDWYFRIDVLIVAGICVSISCDLSFSFLSLPWTIACF